MKKVSVIIPVYNVEKYLKKCLDSVINQTLDDIEIIIVNDGSPDNSQKIINEYIKKYPNKIKSFIKENGGQATARNKGIENVDSEYTIFIDSDDYIDINMLEDMYNTAKTKNADIVVCNYNEGNEENGFNKIVAKKTNYKNEKINYIFSNISPWNKLIKTELILKNNIRFLEKHIYEDLATMPLFGMYSKKIIFLDKAYNYYIIRDGSTMRQKKYNKKLEDIFISLEHLTNEMKKRNFLDEYSEELECLYIEHLLYAGCGRFLEYKEGIPAFKKAIALMKEKYPNWRKNKYYKEKSKLFKITCNLFYNKNYLLINVYNFIRHKLKRKEF